MGRKKRRPAKNREALRRGLQSVLKRCSFIAAPAAVLCLTGACIWILDLVDRKQNEQPYRLQSVHFEWIETPPELIEPLSQELASLRSLSWIDPELCPRVHRRLEQNPWVREVRAVTKTEPGTVSLTCDYRMPIALVQDREYFYMIDEYGIRLPGRYPFEPGWLLIQGVLEPPPAPGTLWGGDDIAAAVELAQLIHDQPYNGQVAAIVVHNYAGRVDPFQTHVKLITDHDGARILWGSAPGQEIEENSVDQKLHILRQNYRRFGRIDANRRTIDISVFPDRFIVPA